MHTQNVSTVFIEYKLIYKYKVGTTLKSTRENIIMNLNAT